MEVKKISLFEFNPHSAGFFVVSLSDAIGLVRVNPPK